VFFSSIYPAVALFQAYQLEKCSVSVTLSYYFSVTRVLPKKKRKEKEKEFLLWIHVRFPCVRFAGCKLEALTCACLTGEVATTHGLCVTLSCPRWQLAWAKQLACVQHFGACINK
jgi:hypothetical protein